MGCLSARSEVWWKRVIPDRPDGLRRSATFVDHHIHWCDNPVRAELGDGIEPRLEVHGAGLFDTAIDPAVNGWRKHLVAAQRDSLAARHAEFRFHHDTVLGSGSVPGRRRCDDRVDKRQG